MRTACLVLAGSLLLALGFSCSDAPAYPNNAQELFEQQCSMCHMRDGTGSQIAPTLHGKKVHWTREALVTYLKDPPATIAKDPRLKAQGKKFSQPMPTYKMLPPWALEMLADHVLAMP